MSNYVSLDEAAKILGLTSDQLVDMRSRGEIFGYRDGSSWKFKQEEIERVQAELGGDALDEEAGGSSILISERQVGPSGSKSGSTIGKGAKSDVGLGSELNLGDSESKIDSDVELVADPSSGSGVKLVNRGMQTPPLGGQESGLKLEADDEDLVGSGELSAMSDLKLQLEGGSGSEVELGSDLNLMSEGSAEASGIDLLGKPSVDSNVLAGSDPNIVTGSKGGTPSVAGSGSLNLGGDLELAEDDEDDLVLGSDSGVGLGSESGINLMSPSDSGLSLEDEPLDLAGTGISGLDLGAEVGSDVGSGSKAGVGSGISGLGSGALVDFQQGEEFQLTPSGGIEADDDSGSQVIELEDSSEFGSVPVGMGGGIETVQEGFGDDGEGFGSDESTGAVSGAVGGALVYEESISTTYVVLLSITLVLMGLSGIIVTDLVRNMWTWDGQSDVSSTLTSVLVKAMPRF